MSCLYLHGPIKQEHILMKNIVWYSQFPGTYLADQVQLSCYCWYAYLTCWPTSLPRLIAPMVSCYMFGREWLDLLTAVPRPDVVRVYNTWRCGGVYVLIVLRDGISGPGDSIGSSASVTVGVNEAVYWAEMWAKVTDTCLINVRLFVNVWYPPFILLLFYYYCYFYFHYCIQPTN